MNYELSKFNPNHDKEGKFSTAQGNVTGKGGAGSKKPKGKKTSGKLPKLKPKWILWHNDGTFGMFMETDKGLIVRNGNSPRMTFEPNDKLKAKGGFGSKAKDWKTKDLKPIYEAFREENPDE